MVLHFSVHGGGVGLLRQVKALGKPIVLWPNLWVEEKLDSSSVSIIREHVELANYVAFKSDSERQHFMTQVNVPEEKIVSCKAVADMCHMKPASRALFPELYGIRDYALWIGLIEPRKNQLSIIEPLRKKGIPLVLVGKYRDSAYYEECRKAGGDNVMFIESLPQRSEIVRSAFQNALFYVELSLEPAGLSALEAGLSGCRLLLSDSGWSREHFLDHAEYVDPLSKEDIFDGIDRVLLRSRNNEELKTHVANYCFPNALMPLIDILRRAAG
ncbi:hypothetical protein DFO54_104281 [Erwinia sp. AG740]|nr:hypothetical protein DFO54_104281 [Erwinia sp. AG740]